MRSFVQHLSLFALALLIGFSPKNSMAGRSSLNAVPLIMTVEETDDSGRSTNVRSDGKGDYVSGTTGVAVDFDTNGNLVIDLNGTNRSLDFSFNEPVDSSNTYRPPSSVGRAYHLGALNLGNIPLQNLGVNGNPDTQCIKMGMGYNDGKMGYRESFHKGLEDDVNSPTSYGRVTRTSVSPAIWKVTVVDACNEHSNVAALRTVTLSGKSVNTLEGYYYLPLRWTLRAK